MPISYECAGRLTTRLANTNPKIIAIRQIIVKRLAIVAVSNFMSVSPYVANIGVGT